MNKAARIERAIEVGREALKTTIKDNDYDYKYKQEMAIDFLELAIESLQQSLEREKNEPLTLGQLRLDEV